ncbi:MAG: hypothetical protein HYY24_22505 [Verrucomicrobia bacterium]|nr:hypothetical protein [Verrucomicrobiota bacterium]
MKWTKEARQLETEWRFFEENRDRFVKEAEGKYALVKGRRLYGFFEAERDALDEGYRRFGEPPFLVHQVTKVEVPINLSSNLIAI